MKKIYKVAVIGCGNRGTDTAEAYNFHPRVELVGLCDVNQNALNSLGEKLKVKNRYTDFEKMIDEVSPDIVAIPVMTDSHYQIARRVIDKGVNIEVEKPFCMYLEEADILISMAKTQGTKIAVHHQSRSGGALDAICETIQKGEIGDIRHIYASGKGYYGGYGLLNIGTHLISYILRLTGHCRSVVATATRNGRQIEPKDVFESPRGMGLITGEKITATMVFDQGVTATLLHHRFSEVQMPASVMEIYGTKGRIYWHRNFGIWLLRSPHYLPLTENDGHLRSLLHEEQPEVGLWESISPKYPSHYDPVKFNTGDTFSTADDYCFVDEYINALDEGREHESSGEEGRHVMEIMFGIFESAAYKTQISLPPINRDHPLARWRYENNLDYLEKMPREYQDWIEEEKKLD